MTGRPGGADGPAGIQTILRLDDSFQNVPFGRYLGLEGSLEMIQGQDSGNIPFGIDKARVDEIDGFGEFPPRAGDAAGKP